MSPYAEFCITEILESLNTEKPVHADDICKKTDIDPMRVSAYLSMLEMAGEVRRTYGMNYLRTQEQPMNTQTNPNYDYLCRSYRNASPALSLDICTGTDAEGWSIYTLYKVDDIVTSKSGKMYKVLGFTLTNNVICKQYGLDLDPQIVTVEFDIKNHGGLDHLPAVELPVSHVSGFCVFQ